MTFIGENKFWVAAWPYDLIVFEKDADGQFMALKEYYTGFYLQVLRAQNENDRAFKIQ